MNLNKRDAYKAASIAKLHEVVAVGVKQGLWTAQPVRIEGNPDWITARVITSGPSGPVRGVAPKVDQNERKLLLSLYKFSAKLEGLGFTRAPLQPR